MEELGPLAASGRGESTERALRPQSERALWIGISGVSVLVAGLVAALKVFPEALRVEGLDVSALPRFHAILNGTTAALLTCGYLAIRRGRRTTHLRLMSLSFALSCLFLLSYVIYHATAPKASFGGVGWTRPAYFFILITHISLAPVLVPLALFTLSRAIRGELPKHRRLARWTLPVWMYVAATGVLVYLMMAPYYPT